MLFKKQITSNANKLTTRVALAITLNINDGMISNYIYMTNIKHIHLLYFVLLTIDTHHYTANIQHSSIIICSHQYLFS